VFCATFSKVDLWCFAQLFQKLICGVLRNFFKSCLGYASLAHVVQQPVAEIHNQIGYRKHDGSGSQFFAFRKDQHVYAKQARKHKH
jgi:hypothetical protein